ncbi:MAG: MarR family transcriptional regulator [Pseudomonadota bacterium]
MQNAPKLSEQVCYALYSTSRVITEAYKPLLTPLNLTYPQYVVMMAMWEPGKKNISEISARTGIGNATLTPLLKRLEDAGFLVRSVDPNNERQKIIALTDKGINLGSEAKKASETALCATGLTESDALEVFRLCAKIKSHLS